MSVQGRLEQLGLRLPTPPQPVANYVPAVQTGNLVFLAGHVPRRDDGSVVAGKLGSDLSVEQGYDGARLAALGCLASLQGAVGDLDRVKRIVKLLCMVNATPDFGDHPKVANGASDLLVEVFGDGGRHARAAVGMGSLPINACVEVEMVVEVA